MRKTGGTLDSTWSRVLVRANLYDVSASLPICVIWVGILGIEVAGLIAVATLVRMGVMLALLHRELGAFLREPGRALTGEELVAKARGLRAGPVRYARRFVLGWGLMAAVIFSLLQLGIPTVPNAGVPDFLMGGLLLSAVLSAGYPIIIELLEPVLLTERATIGAELAKRGENSLAEASSFVGRSSRLNVPFSTAVFLGAVAVGGSASIHAWRVEGVTAQQLRAAEAAARAGRGEELGADLRRVSLEELPVELRAGQELGSKAMSTAGALSLRTGIAAAAAPVGDGSWIVAEAEVETHLFEILAFLLLAPPFFVPALAVANRSVSKAVAEQLRAVRSATQRVVDAGEIRGIPRFEPPDNDEVGLLVRDFNGLLDVLEELSGAAHSVASGDLTIRLERRGDLHDAFRGMLARLREVVGQIRLTAAELATAAAEIQAVSMEHENVVREQSDAVKAVERTVNLLAGAATEISVTASEVLSNADQTLANSNTTLEKITELNAQAGSIAQLLEVIHEVAERSDLLALNGSLEAVRAGEAGRGFALVAAEMRRLAERVGGSVEDVRVRLTEIAESGARTVDVTEAGRILAKRAAEAAREIATITKTQRADTVRVSQSMRGLATSVAVTAAATTQTRAAAEGLALQADDLGRLTKAFSIDYPEPIGG